MKERNLINKHLSFRKKRIPTDGQQEQRQQGKNQVISFTPNEMEVFEGFRLPVIHQTPCETLPGNYGRYCHCHWKPELNPWALSCYHVGLSLRAAEGGLN